MHQIDDAAKGECIRIASENQGVLITSYETMVAMHDQLTKAPWVMVILDEGQQIRNPHANKTMAVKRFSTPHRIILSGSPIQNNLKELWSLFDFICPGRLGTLPIFLEEFASPIEAGNLVGASLAKVATAYQCALALRELTLPCILRRTKAEVNDVLHLPHKQEQVLFCNLTCEQFQVYIEFLQSEQVRKALSSASDKRGIGAVFFAISVLRKVCNHPDLLLLKAAEDLRPPDMWNICRSGKMKVLAELLKSWKSNRHRPLIFVQTIQMLEVIQGWLRSEQYKHLRIDGTTAVKKRLKLIEEFNGDESIFCMLLTTRVGGVGLNIIGADRVVIFDPDWNPMTDVQARERTWRIGQMKDVAVYRLVLTGTIEEKIYQRQVYKHFLSHKVLIDPRQRQFFKWNDLADLFDIPRAPPDFKPQDMAIMKKRYAVLFSKLSHADMEEDGKNETTEVMKAISNLPAAQECTTSRETSDECNAILQTLFDSKGIRASFDHSKVEQPLLDTKIMRDGAAAIAQRAVVALKKSARERASHHISEPTWTGQAGSAGASMQIKRERVKKEPGSADASLGYSPSSGSSGRGSCSADILRGLKRLAAMRSASQRGSQSDGASRPGHARGNSSSSGQTASSRGSRVKVELGPGGQPLPLEDDTVSGATPLPEVLHDADRRIAEAILRAFLDPALAGNEHSLSTGQVLQHLAKGIASHHSDLFKSMLREMCEFSKPPHEGGPGIWRLRPEFRPPLTANT